MREIAQTSHPELCLPARQESSLVIEGARVAMGPDTAIRAIVAIGSGRISVIAPPGERQRHATDLRPVRRVDLSGWLLLPGLVNAHDHLELNLFPRLGPGPFRNYREWASAVFHPDAPPVRDHLRIPKPIRLWWGTIKNLLSGVTTVCHHNPPIASPLIDELPIRVVRRYGWAHSLAYGGDIPEAFRSTPPDAPFIIHLAEGSDDVSRREILELHGLGALAGRTVIVHGVGLDNSGHELLEQAGGAVVWCPTSNLFTLGRTLSRADVLRHGRIALGSDSGMTAAGDLLDEISYAWREAGLSARDTYRMVTTSAAEILRLPADVGRIESGSLADLIAVPDRGLTPCETLVSLTPDRVELVLVGGSPVVMSPAMAERWPDGSLDGFEPLRAGTSEKLVRAPVGALLQQAAECLADKVSLAGRSIST